MSFFHWLRRLFGRSASSGRWTLVGNIVEQRLYGEGPDHCVKRGTPHLTAGTKVYCFPPQWGDGYEQVVVVGRHRGSRRYCRMVVPARHITNRRAKLVYSPEVHRLMDAWVAEHGGRADWTSRRQIERFLS